MLQLTTRKIYACLYIVTIILVFIWTGRTIEIILPGFWKRIVSGAICSQD